MTRQYDAGPEAIEANLDKHMSGLPQVAVLAARNRVSTPDRLRSNQHIKHDVPSRQRPKPDPPRVRLLMSLADASALADVLSTASADSGEQRILDQLWLRTALLEQWRRTRIVERRVFQKRADRTLSALDP